MTVEATKTPSAPAGQDGTPPQSGGAADTGKGQDAGVSAGGTSDQSGGKSASLLAGGEGTAKDAGDGTATGTAGVGDTPPGDAGELVITLPDGVQADKGLLDWFLPVAKEAGLDSEKASKLASGYAQHIESKNEALKKEWAAQGDAWVKELRDDPDFGGQKFEANVALAQQAFRQYGGAPLLAYLDEAGIANHPLLVKAFASIGRAMAEDDTASPTGRAGGRPSDAERYAAFYDHPSSKMGS